MENRPNQFLTFTQNRFRISYLANSPQFKLPSRREEEKEGVPSGARSPATSPRAATALTAVEEVADTTPLPTTKEVEVVL